MNRKKREIDKTERIIIKAGLIIAGLVVLVAVGGYTISFFLADLIPERTVPDETPPPIFRNPDITSPPDTMRDIIDILAEDFSLMHKHLDVLREGKFWQSRRSISRWHWQGENMVTLDSYHMSFAQLAEVFSVEEADAIKFIFYSEELKINSLLHDVPSGVVDWIPIFFLETLGFIAGYEPESLTFFIQIRYFESQLDVPRRSESIIMVDRVSDNYWLIVKAWQSYE